MRDPQQIHAVQAAIAPPMPVTPINAGIQPVDPTAPPTRSRKLKSISQDELRVARALIEDSAKVDDRGRITFEPDDTPPDDTPADDALPIELSAPVPPTRNTTRARLATEAEFDARKTFVGCSLLDWPRRPRGRPVRLVPTVPKTLTPVSTPVLTAIKKPEPDPTPPLEDAEFNRVLSLAEQRYGPILNLKQASELSQLAQQTLRERVCQNRFPTSVMRGRPLRFWTHRFLKEVTQ